MTRRRLTDEEREFRKGAGIPLSRWWPLPAILLACIVAASSHGMVDDCVGYPLDGRGRGLAAIRIVLSVPCSFYFLREGPLGWFLFLGIWGPVPFAVINWQWMKRHRAYWHDVRQRENERRRRKRAEGRADQE